MKKYILLTACMLASQNFTMAQDFGFTMAEHPIFSLGAFPQNRAHIPATTPALPRTRNTPFITGVRPQNLAHTPAIYFTTPQHQNNYRPTGVVVRRAGGPTMGIPATTATPSPQRQFGVNNSNRHSQAAGQFEPCSVFRNGYNKVAKKITTLAYTFSLLCKFTHTLAANFTIFQANNNIPTGVVVGGAEDPVMGIPVSTTGNNSILPQILFIILEQLNIPTSLRIDL